MPMVRRSGCELLQGLGLGRGRVHPPFSDDRRALHVLLERIWVNGSEAEAGPRPTLRLDGDEDTVALGQPDPGVVLLEEVPVRWIAVDRNADGFPRCGGIGRRQAGIEGGGTDLGIDDAGCSPDESDELAHQERAFDGSADGWVAVDVPGRDGRDPNEGT